MYMVDCRSFCDCDSDILAIVIAGVASVAGGLCYLSYHARTMFGELLGLVWGFIASRGAIPILNSRFYGIISYRMQSVDSRMVCVDYGVR